MPDVNKCGGIAKLQIALTSIFPISGFSSSGIDKYSQYSMYFSSNVEFVIIFFGLQAMFGFPLFKSFESDRVSDSQVVIKDASGTCVLIASDKNPRVIHNCPYDKEEIVTIAYKKGSPDLRTHNLKNMNFQIRLS